MSDRKVIRNGFVVTVDPTIGNLARADIVIEGSKIVAIAPDLAVDDAEIVDASNAIVMPGFVDTHRHVWQGPMRSIASDWSLLNYLGAIRMNAAADYRPQDMYAAQLQGGLEAVTAGVTTVADYCHNLISPDHALAALEGTRDSGVRCQWAFGFDSPPLAEPRFPTIESRIAFGRQLALNQFGDAAARVQMAVAPEDMFLWRPDLSNGKAAIAFAREIGARIHLHCNGIRAGGELPYEVRTLARHGLLGPDMVLVHMAFTSSEEWDMVAGHGAHVSMTPDTDLQMGMWQPLTLHEVQQAGRPPSFGTDIVSNNSSNMFFPLRCALQIERARINDNGNFYDGAGLQCEEALRWGTINGAKALGMDDRIGSLSPGKEADIILLKTDSLTMVGWNRHNPAASIIQQAGVNDVDSVLIAGQFAKRHGRIVADENRAIRLLSEAHDHLVASAERRGGFYVDPSTTFAQMQASH